MAITFYPNLQMYLGFDATAEPSITDQVATMSGGETTGPLYDLLDNRRTNTISVDTNGETQDFTVQIETTSSITANFTITDNHNLKTSDATCITGESGTPIGINNAYSGTLGSELSADTIGGVGDTLVTYVADGVSLALFDDTSGDTWQFVFDDVATFDADVTMGEICIGKSYATTYNPELQPRLGFDMPGSSFRESEGAQRYGYSTHDSIRRSWSLLFKHALDADKTNMETVYEITRGSKHPLYVDLAPLYGSTNPHLFYVRFISRPVFTGITKGLWQFTVELEQEI